jgi:ATP-binding cassette subfamily B protein
MLIVQWRLGVLIIALMAAAAVIISLFQPVLVKLNHRVRELNSVITGDLNEGIIGARSIKLLNIEDRMQRELKELIVR